MYTLCNDRRTKIKLRINRILRRMRYNFNEYFPYWRSSITLLAIHRYLRSRLTIVRNNAQKSSIYNWLISGLLDTRSIRRHKTYSHAIMIVIYILLFSLHACLNLPAFLFSILSPLCSLPLSDRSPLSTGLLIPSLKSDPRRRHGLLFTNENCKYKAERGREEGEKGQAYRRTTIPATASN